MAETTRPLLLSRRFAPLFACQFFAAFNDNFLKTALVFLILFGSREDGDALVTAASAIFIAPYFFLSGLGGEIADRNDKARIAQRLKFAEIAVAGVSVAGFMMGSVPVLLLALLGFGMIAALFGPIKYGILPDHLAREELTSGNALVEGATFIAILTGTILGGLTAGGVATTGILVMVFALLCWLSSLAIPPTAVGAPGLAVSLNICRSTAAMIRHLRSRHAAVVGRDGDKLVLAGWYCRAGAAAVAGQGPRPRRRARRHRLSRAVFHRGRRRFSAGGDCRAWPHRAAHDLGRRVADGAFRARSGLGALRRRRRRAHCAARWKH